MKKYIFSLLGTIFMLFSLLTPKTTLAADWVNIGFPDKTINSVFIDPANNNRILASVASKEVQFTENGGQTWQVSSMTPVASPCNEFAQDSLNKNEIWGACSFGLYHSTDFGKSFTRSDYVLLKGYNVFHIKINSKGTLFVNTSAGTILRSYDGLIWQSVTIYGSGYPGLFINPNTDAFYVSYPASNFYISTDDGASSTLIGKLGISDMVFMPNKICSTMNKLNLYCSQDSGYTWQFWQINEIPRQYDNNFLLSIAQNPDDLGNLIISRRPFLYPLPTATKIYSRKANDVLWAAEDAPYKFSDLKISQGAVFAISTDDKNGIWRDDGIAVKPDYLEKYPVIIVPGILGSWQKNGVWQIDPILGTYASLYKNIEINDFEKDKMLFTFPYNWRDDNSKTSELLKQKIEEVKRISGKREVNLVAHSMGGLVVRSYIQGDQYENDVHKVIFINTPQLGSPKNFPVWSAGDTRFGYNLTSTVFLSFLLREESLLSGYYSRVVDYIHEKVISITQLLSITNYLKWYETGSFFNYPFQTPRNIFLEDLNLNKDKISERGIGVVNIIGNTGNNTISGFEVRPTSSFPLWPFGEINDIYYGEGDDTVTTESQGAVPGKSYVLDGVNHGNAPNESSKVILSELGVSNPSSLYDIDPSAKNFLIGAHSPVDFYVTSPDGQKIGFNKETGGEFAEMDNAFYSGNDPTQPEFVVIRNPQQGEYKVTTIGTGDGEYGIESIYADDTTGQELSSMFEGSASVGVENTIDVNLDTEKGEITSTIEDKTPPTTNINLSGNRVGEYYNSDVKVDLISVDTESGVKEIQYSLDGIVWNKFESLTLETDGIYSIQYRAIDNAGNVENAKSQEIKIDKTAPLVILKLRKKQMTHWEKLNIAVEASDNLSGISNKQVLLDGKEITNLNNINLLDFALGRHKVLVRALDFAGNIANSEQEFLIFANYDSTEKDVVYLFNTNNFKSLGTMMNIYVKIRLAEMFDNFSVKLNQNMLKDILKAIEKEYAKKQISSYGYQMLKNDVLYLLGG